MARSTAKVSLRNTTQACERVMTIDWHAFTPGAALTGGLLIGFAAAFLVLTIGRIAGISGILGNVLPGALAGKPGSGGERGWRIAFLLGLAAAPGLAAVSAVPMPPVESLVDWPWLIVAGLLVGVGTRIGSGCTSGHGVCGLARGSLRSLAATLTFMAFGIATVWLLHHVLQVPA
ncbi:MAG: YeeE/YedE family protein [Rhodocyclaceae bacterium]|nr:YeeE/YedE family protein [Rhodocyclaceae bacterium]MCA3073692.1 YeeE/YedE family protein [Rhodocyclaceae bacterium]MCA3088951.1 YeeE/YedE family protein [Rhodocyclaceae bacterium]MCA3095687.1 YeeE/YedE family protein [Rhodocyclaceae bacterium]MCA3097694.1 YeeE/YedE family protein [Rhodocyclaceae bacterium]